MFDNQDLRAAEEAGILSREQATRLEAFLAKRVDPAQPDGVADAESLRFLNNFNDIFVTIGIVILAMGLTAVFGLMFGPSMGGLAVMLPVAGIMWMMAEYFGRRRRMLLPTMALVAIFTLFAGLSLGSVLSGFTDGAAGLAGNLFGAVGKIEDAGIGTFAGFFAAAGLAWWRFRLPFALFLMAISAAGGVYAATGFKGDASLVFSGLVSMIIGLVTLATAIWFDARDPQRITRNTDYAFWLHMAAAPQIILGMRGLITGNALGSPTGVEAFILLGCLIALATLSLSLNRRALILSGLFAFWLSLGNIVDGLGMGGSQTFIASALILGTGIVLLGGGWHTARRLVLKLFPRTGFFARIFPPERAVLKSAR